MCINGGSGRFPMFFKAMFRCQGSPFSTSSSFPAEGSPSAAPSLALTDMTIEEVPPRSLASPSDLMVVTKKDESASLTAPVAALPPPPPFQGFQEDSGELVDIKEPVAEVSRTGTLIIITKREKER